MVQKCSLFSTQGVGGQKKNLVNGPSHKLRTLSNSDAVNEKVFFSRGGII